MEPENLYLKWLRAREAWRNSDYNFFSFSSLAHVLYNAPCYAVVLGSLNLQNGDSSSLQNSSQTLL